MANKIEIDRLRAQAAIEAEAKTVVDRVRAQAAVEAEAKTVVDRLRVQAVVYEFGYRTTVDRVRAQVVVLTPETGGLGLEAAQGSRFQGRRFQGDPGAFQER